MSSSMEPAANSSGLVIQEPVNSLAATATRTLIAVPIVAFLAALILHPTVGAIIALTGFGFALLFGLPALKASLRWHPPTLERETGSFVLGSAPAVTYRRATRRPLDITECDAHFRLRCTEKVTYRQGTDARTEERVVFEQQGHGQGVGTATGVEAELILNVTASAGAPSLELRNNKVEWELEVWLDRNKMPTDKHRFSIEVGPWLDDRFRPQVQDT